MSIRIEQSQSCRAPSVDASVFPIVTEMLDDPKYRLSLFFVTPYIDISPYYCLQDFMLSVCFPWWKPRVMDYYHGDGPDFVNHKLYNEELRAKFEMFFIEVLKLAYTYADDKNTISWVYFLKECKQSYWTPISRKGVKLK